MKLCLCKRNVQTSLGDYSERVTPVPIPNTEVKSLSGENTCGEDHREDSTSPDNKKVPS